LAETVTPSNEWGSEQRSRRVNAFHAPYRRIIADFTSREKALEDLAESFPALLFALATGYGPLEPRTAATAMVLAGRSLREAAAMAGLPLWMKRLPPGAFMRPLLPVPNVPSLASLLGSSLTRNAQMAAIWLDRLLLAHAIAGVPAAEWMARTGMRMHAHETSCPLPSLMAWIWASANRATELGALIEQPWHPTLSSGQCVERATAWRRHIDLACAIPHRIGDAWVKEGPCGEFEVRALRTPRDIIKAARDLDNCLVTWGDRIGYSCSRVFALCRNGVTVAAFEIVHDSDDPPVPRLSQILGYSNRQVSTEIRNTVLAWLGEQAFRRYDTQPISPALQLARQDELLRPFFQQLLQIPGCDAELVERFRRELRRDPPTERMRRQIEYERRLLNEFTIRRQAYLNLRQLLRPT